MDFLTESSIAGQTLLRLVARGSSIIAELQRLVPFTPTAVRFAGFADEDKAAAAAVVERDPRAPRYKPVLADFRYLKTPEMFDRELNRNTGARAARETCAHRVAPRRLTGLRPPGSPHLPVPRHRPL